MAEVKKEMSEAEIAAKSGFGEPAGDEAEADTTETEEETDTTETKEDESAEDSTEEEGEKPARSRRGESKETEEESDESKESEEESEEDESKDEDEKDETEDPDDKKTVPYSLLKSKRAEIKKLQGDLASAQEALKKAKESGDKDDLEEATEEVEASAKELAEELGMDKDGIAKILKAAVKLASKNQGLPKEIEDKLKTLDDLQKQNLEQKEAVHFNKEWESLNISKQYPNAPKAAIKEAQELMDKLAHSKDHHKHELDYILFKNKAKFDTILKVSPKGKSGESSKRIGIEKSVESSGDDEELVDIEDMNPAIMKERENKELEMRRAHAKDKDYRIYNPREN